MLLHADVSIGEDCTRSRTLVDARHRPHGADEVVVDVVCVLNVVNTVRKNVAMIVMMMCDARGATTLAVNQAHKSFDFGATPSTTACG